MLFSISKYKDQLTTNCFKMNNNKINNTISHFNFYLIIQDREYHDDIVKKSNESKIIIIDEFEELNEKYMIICFDFTLIFISLKQLFILHDFFHKCDSKIITFTDEIFEDFTSHINKNNDNLSIINEDDKTIMQKFVFTSCFAFLDLIDSLSKAMNLKNQEYQNMWNIFKRSISGYLIMKNIKMRFDKRIYDFYYFIKKNEEIKITSDDYIELGLLGTGSSSNVKLIYHYESEQLYALKLFFDANKSESIKLFNRERNNYKKLNHPFLSKYFGELNSNTSKGLMLEYIEGYSLEDIRKKNFQIQDKILLIFRILVVFDYLHYNKYVYRDLKQDYIVFNSSIFPILIDLGRLIEINENDDENNEKRTLNFFSDYIPPEINLTNKITCKFDIYSIGLLIIFILFEKEPNVYINFEESRVILRDENIFTNLPKKYFKIKEICENCIIFDPQKRPHVSKIIDDFYYMIYSDIPKRLSEIQIIKSVEKTQSKRFFDYWALISFSNEIFIYRLFMFFYSNYCIPLNTKRAIYYLEMAVNLNSYYAQNVLAILLIEGIIVKQDIAKSLFYFSLSIKQDYMVAQYNLGSIYYYGKYVKQNIKKAIYYLTLSANQNYSLAQSLLGEIYYNSYDISKSIHYLKLAANQNDSFAQVYLGIIYMDNENLRNINESIRYLTLSANQNNVIAQALLGAIYINSQYIKVDINKSLYYLNLSANQGYPYSFHMLGEIYYYGEYVQRDVKKALDYFTIPANQKLKDSQFFIGLIYYEGKYIKQDIQKAIYYFTLAAYQHFPSALCYLGAIYYEGKYVERDINKAIFYLKFASKQDRTDSQSILGIIYYEQKKIKESIEYFTLAAKKYDITSNFKLGTIYFDNIYVARDINKAIQYYSNASSFLNQYAKNNLGIIYKNGIGIVQNIKHAKKLFKEAIDRGNDDVSKYNLAHLYFYQHHNKFDFKKCLNLLIDSSQILLHYSLDFICLIFVYKYKKISYELIENDLKNQSYIKPSTIFEMIKNNFIEEQYDKIFNNISKINFVYDIMYKPVEYSSFESRKPVIPKQESENKIYIISKDFYEGFYL